MTIPVWKKQRRALKVNHKNNISAGLILHHQRLRFKKINKLAAMQKAKRQGMRPSF